LFLIPVLLVYELVRQLWQNVRPVPFTRHEILLLMTSHFGIEGATEYVDGFRYGFVERPSLKNCGYGRSLSSVGPCVYRQPRGCSMVPPRTRATPAKSRSSMLGTNAPKR
jgi:hypothetical protein